MWLENLDFAGPGQGWRLTEAGETALGGRLQVRDEAGTHQVTGVRTALGHAYGGGSQYFSMWVVSATPRWGATWRLASIPGGRCGVCDRPASSVRLGAFVLADGHVPAWSRGYLNGLT